MSKPPAADDFSAISQRLKELQQERETPIPWCEPCNLFWPQGHGRRCPGCGKAMEAKKIGGSLW